MRRSLARLASVCALAIATAALAGGAAACGGGDGRGGGGHDNGGGSYRKSDNGGGQTSSSDQSQSHTSDSNGAGDTSSAGTKPGNDTPKWTKTEVGHTPDVSKRYGNGTTAAEIAKSRGANDRVQLAGPGNSQPHKVCGRDVHAVKSYDGQGYADCGAVAGVQATVEVHRSESAQKELVLATPATTCGETKTVVKSEQAGDSANDSASHVKCVLTEHAATPAVLVQQTPTCTTPMVAAIVTDETNQHGQFEGEHQDGSSTTTVLKPGEARCVAPANLTAPAASNASLGTALVPAAMPAPVPAPTPAVLGAIPATQVTPSTATPLQGGVLGAQATLNTPKKNSGGVLGTVGNVAGATLPFTGFPLWAAVLVAAALVAAGLLIRRRGTGAPRP